MIENCTVFHYAVLDDPRSSSGVNPLKTLLTTLSKYKCQLCSVRSTALKFIVYNLMMHPDLVLKECSLITECLTVFKAS